MKKSILIFLILVIASAIPVSAKSDYDILKLRDTAEEYYKKGLNANNKDESARYFDFAVKEYKKILDDRVNGYIYYNIGNCYFMMDKPGFAILNYRRAQKYIPGDMNLKNNLNAALKQTKDRIPVPQINKVLELIFFWHFLLSFNSRLIFFLIFFIILFTVMIIRLFFYSIYLKWIKFVCIIILICLGLSIAYQYYNDNTYQRGVITVKSVVARKGNADSYEPSFEQPLHEGTEFTIITVKDKWYKIELDNGSQCWIKKVGDGLPFSNINNRN